VYVVVVPVVLLSDVVVVVLVVTVVVVVVAAVTVVAVVVVAVAVVVVVEVHFPHKCGHLVSASSLVSAFSSVHCVFGKPVGDPHDLSSITPWQFPVVWVVVEVPVIVVAVDVVVAATHQIRTVLSQLPLTINEESCDTATEVTSSMWSSNTCNCLPVIGSHIRTVPS
jgi:hypothetical protein